MGPIRATWSAVQVVVLTITVAVCGVMLLRDGPGPGGIYVIGAVCFGLALIGHATVLLLARSARRGAPAPNPAKGPHDS
ncbi:hypothetical protein EDF31_101589 [Curtobacterium sp. PhB142]|jgi:hypothetical protein|nr:hypothetical protein EDF28_1753 [Curtobacterium sp. PhB137]TCL79030.1 hypothetical protein EDF23_10399 [Curtobacterium sp. PhB128]TCL88742.1 hypothetical protein EDF31_101589 [Curtobacterium sp. PhB142]TCL97498.1 hypothetical protein EDF29_103285 [Curtobacterium sp. PhB138]TCM03895.1 hypothetical protein EDF26_102105 [Curtobacterium sp. PhB134]